MSTLDQIDTAIRAHMAQEHPGQLVVGWAIVAGITDEDDDANRYDTVTPEGQPAHHTVGLYRLGQSLVEGSWDE